MGEWQRISDFRAGIKQVVSAAYPAGTAQADGTYRCYARGPGVLAPLPERNNNIFLFDSEAGPVTVPPCDPADLESPQWDIIGLHARNPVYWSGSTLTGEDQNNTDLLVGLQWHQTIQGTVTRRKYRLYRYFRHFNAPFWQELWTGTVDVGAFDPAARPENMDFVTGRSNSAAPTQAGAIVTAMCVAGFLRMWPTDTATSTNTTAQIPGDRESSGGLCLPTMIVGHQGRLVVFPLLTLGAGEFSVWASNEALYYTNTNDWTLTDDVSGFFNQVVGYELPSGYQVAESLTFDEFLMIKSQGGAVMMRGAINNPQNVILPYVRSCGMSFNRGTKCPIGFVYPVDGGGLWLWAGGDSSVNLTPDMDPDFWRPPPELRDGTTAPYGHRSSTCAAWGEWVLLPNNWMFDTDTQAMWRVDDPERVMIHRWTVDWRGRYAYGAPQGIRADSGFGDPMVVEYAVGTKAADWSWRSQPMPGTLDRDVRVKAVKVVGAGGGRFQVNVRSRRDQAGRSLGFDAGLDRRDGELWSQLLPVNVAGSHVEFTVTARGVTDSSPAPELHELAFELEEDTRVTGASQ